MTFSRRSLLAAGTSALFLSGVTLGCARRPAMLEIQNTAAGTLRDVTVPFDPKRLAVLDFSVMENLQAWGLTDRMVAAVSPTTLTWIKKPGDGVALVKSLKSAETAPVKAVNPDLIFISGRIALAYDAFNSVAATLVLVPDYKKGAWASFKENITTLARIFGKENEAAAAVAGFQKRIDAIRAKAAGERIAVMMCVGGRAGLLPPEGRCSLLTEALGFTNVMPARTDAAPKKGAAPRKAPTAAEIAAGNAKTFAKLKETNPDRVFVLNKDLAVGAKEPKLLEAITAGQQDWAGTAAVKAGRVTELTGPAWYLGEGGVYSMDRMLTDVEKALGL